MKTQVSSIEGRSVAVGMAGVVAIDTRLTEELIAEGIARDFIHDVQAARRSMNLDHGDKIEIETSGELAFIESLAKHRDEIFEAVNCTAIYWPAGNNPRSLKIKPSA